MGLDWSAPGFRAFCHGYADAGRVLDTRAPERVAHWVGLWVLAIYTYLAGIAPEYLDAARAAAARCVAGEVPDLTPIPVG